MNIESPRETTPKTPEREPLEEKLRILRKALGEAVEGGDYGRRLEEALVQAGIQVEDEQTAREVFLSIERGAYQPDPEHRGFVDRGFSSAAMERFRELLNLKDEQFFKTAQDAAYGREPLNLQGLPESFDRYQERLRVFLEKASVIGPHMSEAYQQEALADAAKAAGLALTDKAAMLDAWIRLGRSSGAAAVIAARIPEAFTDPELRDTVFRYTNNPGGLMRNNPFRSPGMRAREEKSSS